MKREPKNLKIDKFVKIYYILSQKNDKMISNDNLINPLHNIL